jgi:hypothetical protein
MMRSVGQKQNKFVHAFAHYNMSNTGFFLSNLSKNQKNGYFPEFLHTQMEDSYKSNIRMKRRAINALPYDLNAQIF